MASLSGQIAVDDKTLLTMIEQQRGIVDYYRFSLVSFNKTTINAAFDSIVDQLQTSPEFQEILFVSRSLLLLILLQGRTRQLAGLNLNWNLLCTTLLRSVHIADDALRNYVAILNRHACQTVIHDLYQSEHPFCACILAQRYLGASQLAYAGFHAQHLLVQQALHAWSPNALEKLERFRLLQTDDDQAARWLARSRLECGADLAILENVFIA
eukprot:jgi/Hompol1/2680/HPOL_006119-RA